MYFIRMSFKWKDEHLHDNRLRSREGAPGRDSIHKQELPPHPPIFAIFFIRTNKHIHSPARPTAPCAKYDNKERRAGGLYYYFSRIKQ